MVIALLDEAMPMDSGGLYYVVATAVILHDHASARTIARSVIEKPGRTRAFHWCTEGTTARGEIVKSMVDMGAIAHVCVHYPTGRKKQATARDHALDQLVPHLVHEGVDELIIESRREFNDERDGRVISRLLTEMECPDAFSYSWKPKTEPLLWFADALCGAVSDFLLRESPLHYEQLRTNGVITEPIYINESVPKETVPVPGLGGGSLITTLDRALRD